MPRPRFTGEDGEYSSNVILSTDARVRVQVGGRAIGKWTIRAVPDVPPVISLDRQTQRHRAEGDQILLQGQRRLWRRQRARGAQAQGRARQAAGRGIAAAGMPAPAAMDQTSYVDLTGHPYAGLVVEGRLEARDAIGQVGTSAPFTFQHPGARLHRSAGARPDRTAPASGDRRRGGPQDRDADAGCAGHRSRPLL